MHPRQESRLLDHIRSINTNVDQGGGYHAKFIETLDKNDALRDEVTKLKSEIKELKQKIETLREWLYDA
tara:strand:+ start:482 stop:688 length:207 start_codon:yes stop_codon:yes gene_type:complete